MDTTPLVGNVFEGFGHLQGVMNFPMRYVPIFSDDAHQEWFFNYFQQDLCKRFQNDEFKIPSKTRLDL